MTTNAKTGGRAKRKWCKHIEWGNTCKEYFSAPLSESFLRVFHVPRSWKFCPLCGTKKPEEPHEQ